MLKNETLICEKCDKFDCCGWFGKIKPFTDYARNPLPIVVDIVNCPMFALKDGTDSEEV